MSLGKDDCEEDEPVSLKALTLKMRLIQIGEINKKLTLHSW